MSEKTERQMKVLAKSYLRAISDVDKLFKRLTDARQRQELAFQAMIAFGKPSEPVAFEPAKYQISGR